MGVIRQFASNVYQKVLSLLLPGRRTIADVRALWGKPIEPWHWRADRYFRLTSQDSEEAFVDDKTWNDLEFPRIFADASGTVTSVGTQILYRQMRARSSNIGNLSARHKQHLEMQLNANLREALQKRLLLLQDDGSKWISEYLFGELPPLPATRWKAAVWGLFSLFTPIVLVLLGWPIWPWLLVLLVNVVVLVRIAISGHVTRDIYTLQSCLQLIRVADSLSKIDNSLLAGDVTSVASQIAALRKEQSNRNQFRRSLLWLSFLKLPTINAVARLLNVAVLFELNAHIGAMRSFGRLRSKLRESFRLVGEIDAAISVGSWLMFRPYHCFATLVKERRLLMEGGRHPLLSDQVTNSIVVTDRSVLVTGSNMAGKTTFIKTLGINAILAQTLGFCFASSATIPLSDVMASIHTEHSVETGLSHYMSATLRVKSFLEKRSVDVWNVFVIDEIFSGTNTTERIAIAQAVLRALSRNALVLATTHDVELQEILDDCFDFYHFQEDPNVDGFFDYLLRSGKTSARNAIRLLARLDFPPEVIADAEALKPH